MKQSFGLEKISAHRSAIMGFAALWIFINHEWQYLFQSIPELAQAEQFIKRIGFCGVDFFLFLSGIGLIFSIEKSNVLSFYRRRFARILLPFLTMGVIFAFSRDWSFEVFLKNVTGYHFFTKSIYSLLWFVPAVSVFYLAFPLYYTGFKHSPSKLQFTLVVLTVWVLFSLWAAEWMRNDLFGFTNRIPIFLAGIYAGWLIREKKVTFHWISWILCGTLFILGLVLAYKTNFEQFFLLVPVSNCCIPNFLIATSGSCLLAGLFELLSHRGKWVLKFLGFYGTISLEFYCVQEALGKELRHYIGNRLTAGWVILAEFLCSTLAALALYWSCGAVKKLLSAVTAKLLQKAPAEL